MLKAMDVFTCEMVISVLLVGSIVYWSSLSALKTIKEDCNRFVSPINQSEILELGCEKYASIEPSLYALNCPKDQIAFVWENSLPEYGCIDSTCCGLVGTYLTTHTRLAACGLLTVGVCYVAVLMCTTALRTKI